MKRYVGKSFSVTLGITMMGIVLCHAQDFSRDTSFNLADDYRKNIKKYPHIQSIPLLRNEIHIIRDVPYPSHGERQLHLDLYRPRSSHQDLPTIVMIHGGGWRSGNKEMMSGFASHLAHMGYAVVVPEYRLSLEAAYPAGIHDLQQVLRWFYHHTSTYGFDPSKLAVLGTSSGAQMASQLGNNIDTKYRVSATINIDGVLAFRHPESEEGAAAIQWLGGTYEEIPEVWLEASPLHNVNKSTAPILFIGSSTPRFHAGKSDMIDKLNTYSIYSAMTVFEDSPHTFWFYEPWFTPMLQTIDSFLKKVWR